MLKVAGKNPFPGMNPWLESCWGEIHHGIIQYGRDLIQPSLPPDLYAGVEEMLYVIDLESDDVSFLRPDVTISPTGAGAHPVRPERTSVGTATIEPVRILLPEETLALGRIEIRETAGANRIVTAIEVISPANKQVGQARRDYLQKRRKLVAAGANVVEIDLLRAGPSVVSLPESTFDKHPEWRAGYKVAVRPATPEDPWVDLYSIPVRQRLPGIKIPLRENDKQVVLDLQAAVDQAYEHGRFDARIDYSKIPEPPLNPDDAAWADSLLRAAAAR